MPRITPFAIAWLSLQVVVDTFITSKLIYFNLHTKKALIYNRQLL